MIMDQVVPKQRMVSFYLSELLAAGEGMEQVCLDTEDGVLTLYTYLLIWWLTAFSSPIFFLWRKQSLVL